MRDRGCLGCHSAKISDDVIGNDFAANLTRVGEKAKFDYLVRWVAGPEAEDAAVLVRAQARPEARGLRDGGVPFEFEHTNPAWPKEWGTVLTHQMTVMPNLRLSPTDARDIAT